ncbi:hypothetical protein ATO12_17585 [Aquimarina atlantica]|uniref:tRNA_anti-like n=1 Tax=Aquimarina atlantica TaxID=1317122 RepID=A0A023BUP2_9FLAO|nr:hypothetical protein [Aquimarina atlantica]EZH73747.1 hypothetical protein ATO12_17585 [Aquimarina atlantica]
MKTKNFILLVLAFITAISIVLLSYMYKEHRTIHTEKVDTNTTAIEFYAAFIKDKVVFNAIHLDKAVELQGLITAIASNHIVLDQKISVTLERDPTALKINKKVTIKGRYVGFDDLLEQLKIDQGTVISSQ